MNSVLWNEAVEFRGSFNCTQERLWRALTDSTELSAWLGGTACIEPRVGASVQFDLPDEQIRASGLVRLCAAPRPDYRVAMIEHTFVEAQHPDITSICRWAVRTTAAGCDLIFTHDGLGEADREHLASVWSRRLSENVDREIATASGPITTVAEATAVLHAARRILLVSFIGPEVPTALIRAGFDVFAKIGPQANAWAHCRLQRGELQFDARSTAPEVVDLVHLDVSDAFDEYLAVAKSLGAKTLWYHSARTRPPEPHDDRGCWVPAAQSMQQRRATETAGLTYIDNHYIADVAHA